MPPNKPMLLAAPRAAADGQTVRRAEPRASSHLRAERSAVLYAGDPLASQYAFLELPKLPAHKPRKGADLWAWLFVHAPELEAVPADLPPGPHREALDLANKATFSQAELDAYQKVMDEIEQAREYGEVKWEEGHKSGLAEGKVAAILAILAARSLRVSAEVRTIIETCRDVSLLDQWIARAATVGSAEEVITTRDRPRTRG